MGREVSLKGPFLPVQDRCYSCDVCQKQQVALGLRKTGLYFFKGVRGGFAEQGVNLKKMNIYAF